MYCIIKCIVQGKQARVKNAICITRPQCVKIQEQQKQRAILNVSQFNDGGSKNKTVIDV